MKVPVKTIKLAEALDPEYGDYFFSLPRSMDEGVLHSIQMRNIEAERLLAKVEKATPGPAKDTLEQQAADYRRESNAIALDLVSAWNFDDKQSNPLPLPNSTDDPKVKVLIVSQLPLEVIALIGREVWTTKPAIAEKTEDFSNASSEGQDEAN